jgi:hypothetical protein
MGEQEVTRLLGTPLKAEVSTCGALTPKPWTCKKLTYGDRVFNGISATFEEAAGEWRLNSWTVY